MSNLVNHLEETVFSKQRVFFLFEILAEGIVLVRGDDRPERRKEDCILPCLVRSVHAKERAQRIGQLVAVRDVLEGAEASQFANLRRETPAGRVLLLKKLRVEGIREYSDYQAINEGQPSPARSIEGFGLASTVLTASAAHPGK